MKNLSRAINRNTHYFTGYLIFAFTLTVFCFGFKKADGFLLINGFHFQSLDNFFVLFTQFGNGLFVMVIVILMLVLKKIGWAFQTVISFLVSGLCTQLIKHCIYSPRPKAFFGSGVSIHYIQGITYAGNNSFPSGHSATIFALTTLLSFYFPDKKWGLFFLTMAILTGFSRIYLSQHFPIDVLAGAIIGGIVSLAIYRYFPVESFEKKFSKNGWEHQSVKLQ